MKDVLANTSRITLSVDSVSSILLDEFAKYGVSGKNRSEVATRIIQDYLVDEGVIKLSKLRELSELYEEQIDILNSPIVDHNGKPISTNSPEFNEFKIITQRVNLDFFRWLCKSQSNWSELSARDYEEIIAELSIRKGFDVELTKNTRDGGFDISIAKESSIGSFLYLVECKKWAVGRPVGVDVIRSLYGVVEETKATAGIVATTSVYTKDAKEYRDRIENRMSLLDFNDIRSMMMETLNPWT